MKPIISDRLSYVQEPTTHGEAFLFFYYFPTSLILSTSAVCRKVFHHNQWHEELDPLVSCTPSVHPFHHRMRFPVTRLISSSRYVNMTANFGTFNFKAEVQNLRKMDMQWIDRFGCYKNCASSM